MEYLWEIGVLLIGIGAFYALINLGLALKELSGTLNEIQRLVKDNYREIEDIIIAAANISTTADDITYGVTTGLANFSPISSFFGGKKNKSSSKTRNARDYRRNRRRK